MTLPFITAKTCIPACLPNLVARPRLFESLNAGLQPGVKVTVLAAPAGAGKTTLLVQWLRQLPANFRVSWLSLDESDNSLPRFFSYLFAAISEIDGDFPTRVEANPDFSAIEGVSYLVEQVADLEQNLLLVLDDYHTITSSEVHQALKLLIDHLPVNLRLVIAGRVEPPLPLARLRARGQLVEVRPTDLRFSIEETGSFLQSFPGLAPLSLKDKLLKQLNTVTEGWAAGLQMSALALRSEINRQCEDSSAIADRILGQLDGSHRYILDFLLDEVLSHESTYIREFLMKTCLLERFNADLCTALGLEDAQETLEYLERANLFIVPLDGQRVWYRYHHLFADVLQKELLHTHLGLTPDFHRRAADWFEAHGFVDEALVHAQKTGDPAQVADLVERHALETILQGRIATATHWLESLPDDTLLSRPRLCMDRAWLFILTSRTEAAQPYLDRAEFLLDHDTEISLEDALAIRSEVLGLLSFRENTYGRADEAIRLARRALEISPADHLFLQCSNRLFLAGGLLRTGQLEEALTEYRTIQSLGQRLENPVGLALLEADFLHYLAMQLNARGAMGQAKALLRQTIQEFEARAEGQCKAAALFLYVALGKILFLENDLAGAEQALERALHIDPISMSVAAFDGWGALWWTKIGQGDYLAARNILTHLEQATRGYDEKIIRAVILIGALQDLLEDQVDHAAARLAQVGLSGEVGKLLAEVNDSELMSWRSNEFFTLARVLAAQQRSTASLEVLDRMEKAAETIHIDWVRYRVWITQAIVHRQAGRHEQALAILTRLLENTSKMEANPARIYLAAGEPARALLKEAQRCGLHLKHVSRLLTEFPPEPTADKSTNLPEALTGRELDVLHLMANGMRNQEIGARLYVSLNTIRYHTTNIFGKLSVDNRTAAVNRARELGIL